MDAHSARAESEAEHPTRLRRHSRTLAQASAQTREAAGPLLGSDVYL